MFSSQRIDNNYSAINMSSNSLIRNEKLLWALVLSLHPPHIKRKIKENQEDMVPNPTFPFCIYDSEDQKRDGSGEEIVKYCDAFEPAFNDHGLCYTFNNVNQAFSDAFQG